MPLAWLDHVNIRTANLKTMGRFYQDVLGLKVGPRPPFSFNGLWLYCNDKAAVHLVEVPRPPSAKESRIEHFAFRANGLGGFLANLRTLNVAYRVTVVPQLELRQVHISDPDSNHIEIVFVSEEEVDSVGLPGSET